METTGGVGTASRLDPTERDACLHHLGDLYAEGRISADELEERVQATLAAKSRRDLAALLADWSVEKADAANRDPLDLSIDLDEEADGRADDSARLAPWRSRAFRSRWVAAAVVAAAGGLLLAALGPRSIAAEFLAGLAVGLLGFLTHWGLTVRAGRSTVTPPVSEESAEAEPLDIGTQEPAPRTFADREAALRRLRISPGIVPQQRPRD